MQNCTTMTDWNGFGEGASLGGLYILKERLRQDATGAFFSAATSGGERLLVKLMPDQDPHAPEQFARWERALELRAPHLLEVRDVGRSEMADGNYIYAVFEYPDDMLATAVEQGALSEAEICQVEDAALAGLRYLHSQGFVHGSVDPDHVVAVGDAVKLATDTVRPSDDADARAEDLRQLRDLERRLRAPESPGQPAAAVIATELPEPLKPPEMRLPLAPPVRHTSEFEERPARSFPKWIVVALALLAIAIVVWNLERKPGAAPTKPVNTAVTQPAPAPPPAPARPADGTWRVIAFTYRSRDLAAKKATQINARWPELRAGVFEPKQERGYFLVTLGDGMPREDATRLQRKARSMGLPRDTFVKNYSE